MLSTLAALWLSPVFAQDPDASEPGSPDPRPEETELDHLDVESWPATSSQMLLRAFPGAHVIGQDGAEPARYGLRGFDAATGQDLAVSIEGVPLNEPMNPWRRGHVELHLLPLPLVTGLTLAPGAHRLDRGDFARAGSADYQLGLAREGVLLQGAFGSDLGWRGELGWRDMDADPRNFAYASWTQSEGLGQGRAHRKINAAFGAGGNLGPWQTRLFALGYDGVAEAPGLVREPDVDSGAADPLDAWPGDNGGTSRQVLSALQAERAWDEATAELMAWGAYRAIDWTQDVTGYANDPDGDGQDWVGEGWRGGARAVARADLTPVALEGGVELRGDLGEGTAPSVDDDDLGEAPAPSTVDHPWHRWNGAGWAGLALNAEDQIGLRAGVRADHLADVADGAITDRATAISPRAGLVVWLGDRASIFTLYGRSFRSPADLTDPITRTDSAEGGARWAGSALDLRLSGTYALSQDEVLFNHVTGAQYLSGNALRLGGALEVGVTPTPHTRLDATGTWTDARDLGSGDPLPYAPQATASGGAALQEIALADGGAPLLLTAGLRGWWIGPRPGPGGNTIPPYASADLSARLDWRPWLLEIGLYHLPYTPTYDGAYWLTSQPDPSGAPEPATHLHAAQPFLARAAIGVRM